MKQQKVATRTATAIGPIVKLPPQESHGTVVAQMRSLKIGEGFDGEWTHKTAPYAFARAAGIRVSVRSIGGGMLRVRRERDLHQSEA